MDPFIVNIFNFLFRLHNGEHVKVISDIVEMAKNEVVTIPEAQSRMAKLEEMSEHEKLLFKLSPESPETKEIAAYDVEREQAWREILSLLKFYSANREPAVKAAAEALLQALKTYGDVPAINLYEETSYIDHALDDLHKPEHTPQIALIPGLSGLITILENANAEVDTHYRQRMKDAEAAKKLGTLGDYRKQVDTVLIDLFKILNTVYNYNEITAKNPATREKIQRIADIIDGLFTQLKKNLAREHRGAYQKPGETNPETPGGGDGEGDGFETPDITNPPAPFE